MRRWLYRPYRNEKCPAAPSREQPAKRCRVARDEKCPNRPAHMWANGVMPDRVGPDVSDRPNIRLRAPLVFEVVPERSDDQAEPGRHRDALRPTASVPAMLLSQTVRTALIAVDHR